MGGASSEIADGHHRGAARGGLLRPHGHRPHVQAPGPAHRGLGPLRARVRPLGDRAGRAPVLRAAGGERRPGSRADGILDVRGEVPEPFVVSVPVARVHRLLGAELGPAEIARLIEPIGFACWSRADADGVLTVMVPTNRPDVRPGPTGSTTSSRRWPAPSATPTCPVAYPTWPQPGRLTPLPARPPLVKEILPGLGASEGWTDTFVSAAEHADAGPDRTGRAGGEPARRREAVPAPLADARAPRRAGLQRRAGVSPTSRLFEVGVVFSHPDEGTGGWSTQRRGRHGRGGAARGARAARRGLRPRRRRRPGGRGRLAGAGRRAADLDGVRLDPAGDGVPPLPGLHPTRSRPPRGPAPAAGRLTIGSVGEIDPAVAARFELDAPGGVTTARRVGWLEVDLVSSSTRRRCPAGSPPAARSAASPRPTSTWRSSWRTGTRPTPVADGPARGRQATCSSRWSCSTSTGGRAWARVAQPGLPPALLRRRPHAHRRGGGRLRSPLHRGGRRRASGAELR